MKLVGLGSLSILYGVCDYLFIAMQQQQRQAPAPQLAGVADGMAVHCDVG